MSRQSRIEEVFSTGRAPKCTAKVYGYVFKVEGSTPRGPVSLEGTAAFFETCENVPASHKTELIKDTFVVTRSRQLAGEAAALICRIAAGTAEKETETAVPAAVQERSQDVPPVVPNGKKGR